jgi:hypothetical protein
VPALTAGEGAGRGLKRCRSGALGQRGRILVPSNQIGEEREAIREVREGLGAEQDFELRAAVLEGLDGPFRQRLLGRVCPSLSLGRGLPKLRESGLGPLQGDLDLIVLLHQQAKPAVQIGKLRLRLGKVFLGSSREGLFAWVPRVTKALPTEKEQDMLGLIAACGGATSTLLWVIAAILIIAGIVTLIRGGVLYGIGLIVVGLLIGPGGVSIFC